MDLFSPKPAGNAAAIAKLKASVRQLLGLSEETVVMVTELRCAEPGCPPLETVIAILVEGSSRQLKIHKPISEISPDDLKSLP
jgi:hypothetical protein